MTEKDWILKDRNKVNQFECKTIKELFVKSNKKNILKNIFIIIIIFFLKYLKQIQ